MESKSSEVAGWKEIMIDKEVATARRQGFSLEALSEFNRRAIAIELATTPEEVVAQ